MSSSKGAVHSIQVKDRDIALMRGLFECRIMTIAQVGDIYFDGALEYAKKRLKQLKVAGYIRERPRNVNEPSVLSLARGGLELLRENGMLTEYPQFSLLSLLKRADVSERMIRHEIAVMDVKAAFHRAVRGSGTLTIPEFGTWPRLYEFKARHPRRGMVPVQPDGFLRIQEKKKDGSTVEHAFFLEVDLSTESLDVIASKASCYLDYYRSGGFAVKKGHQRDEYHRHPFRVLIVCKSPERKDTVAERLLQCRPPIRTQVMISTLEEVVDEPFGGIWKMPRDYREPASRSSELLNSALMSEFPRPAASFSHDRWDDLKKSSA